MTNLVLTPLSVSLFFWVGVLSWSPTPTLGCESVCSMPEVLNSVAGLERYVC